jgi:hypothetical protein
VISRCPGTASGLPRRHCSLMRASGSGLSDSPLEGTGFEPSVPREASAFPSPVRADFSGGGKSSGGDMSRSRNLDRMTRYQWFESGFLQRRESYKPAGRNPVPYRRWKPIQLGRLRGRTYCRAAPSLGSLRSRGRHSARAGGLAVCDDFSDEPEKMEIERFSCALLLGWPPF